MTIPFNVRNPRTGVYDHRIVPPTPAALDQDALRLRQAQIDWSRIGVEKRIEVLQHFKQAVLAQRERLIEALVQDTGRLSLSILEIDSLLLTLDRWCRAAPALLHKTQTQTAVPFIQLHQTLVPYPLIGVISPWNFPLLLSTLDVIPALLAGCAAIVKPSELASRFVTPLMAAVHAVPILKDVLSFVEGGGDTGAALIERVDLVCFTGSVATGRTVAATAAKRLIPAFLELGGKDPAVVLASADIEQATSAILWGSVVNTGQSCLSIERIYVADSIFEAFVNRLVAKAKALQLAYPNLDSGEIGPIMTEPQAATIRAHLLDAVNHGAVVHCGGAVEQKGGGWWCAPTVLTAVNHAMKVMTDETFGPILPVMPFSTPEEAIHFANDTVYGLSAAVFAAEETEAISVAQHIDAGAISINDAGLTALIYEGEKQSFKQSGLGGSRMGAASMMRFLRKQAFLVKTNSDPDPWWFS